MKVKIKKEIPLEYRKEFEQTCSAFDKNKIYTVIGVSYDDFRLINELGSPALFLGIFFDIIENDIDENWAISVNEYHEDYSPTTNLGVNLDPKEFPNYFYEDLFDYKRESIDIFLSYIKKHNLKLVANLAYAPKFKREYYNNILDEIET